MFAVCWAEYLQDHGFLVCSLRTTNVLDATGLDHLPPAQAKCTLLYTFQESTRATSRKSKRGLSTIFFFAKDAECEGKLVECIKPSHNSLAFPASLPSGSLDQKTACHHYALERNFKDLLAFFQSNIPLATSKAA